MDDSSVRAHTGYVRQSTVGGLQLGNSMITEMFGRQIGDVEAKLLKKLICNIISGPMTFCCYSAGVLIRAMCLLKTQLLNAGTAICSYISSNRAFKRLLLRCNQADFSLSRRLYLAGGDS